MSIKLNALFSYFINQEPLRKKLQNYINSIHPKAYIKDVLGDGFCVIRAFQEGLSLVYNIDKKISEVKENLRSEILQNYQHYAQFSTDGVNVLVELDKFLADPLKYYNTDTVDLFLIALGNLFACKTIVFRVTEKNEWTTNISNPDKIYDKTLYFGMTGVDHIDLVLDTNETLLKNKKVNFGEISGSDSEIEITNYIPPPNDKSRDLNNEPKDTPIETSTKFELTERKNEDNLPAKPINISTDSSKESDSSSGNENSDCNNDEAVRKYSGKVYVDDEYWQGVPQKHVNILPYDIDGKGVFIVPVKPQKRFESTKDRRPRSSLMASKRGEFSGDRYITNCKGSTRSRPSF